MKMSVFPTPIGKLYGSPLIHSSHAPSLKRVLRSCTGRVDSLPDRKWREIQQQPGTVGPGNMLGCCLIYFHFLSVGHPEHGHCTGLDHCPRILLSCFRARTSGGRQGKLELMERAIRERRRRWLGADKSKCSGLNKMT